MKRIGYFLNIIALAGLLLTSCTKEVTTEDKSIIEYFVDINLNGGTKDGTLLLLPIGEPFVDPGFTATEQSVDKTSSVQVDGTVDGETVGLYEINYSAVNKNGYNSSIKRTVIVYDPAAPPTDLTGKYSSKINRKNVSNGTTSARGPYDISIKKLAPGFFSVTDFLGGWYEFGSFSSPGVPYGEAYAMPGYFQLNDDNTLSLVYSYCRGFGDSLDDLVNGVYDPVTKGILWRADYAGILEFNVTLKFKN